jgi:hypothetical protein
MLKRIFSVSALSCLLSVAQANTKIPLRTVPHDIKATIQHYVPGAHLTLAKIGADDVYGPIYKCNYWRPGRSGFIAVSSLGLLVEINEPLTIRNVPVSIRHIIWRETKGGAIRRVSLNCQAGQQVYKVKADYGLGTNREISLVIGSGNRVLSRDFAPKGVFFWF